MSSFKELLTEQRWDDHRFYHRSLINQSLHFLSASVFICAYVVAFYDLAVASLMGWCISMVTRQAGHFFFEPKGFDDHNHVTHEYKEEVKVGYNLVRKYIFMSIWALSPLPLLFDPTLFGLFVPHQGAWELLRHVGLIWLGLAVAGLVVRVFQLWSQRDLRTGIVWATKIVTDPFHDVMLYHKAPLRLLRGERIVEAHGR